VASTLNRITSLALLTSLVGLLSSCSVDPYCLGCVDADVPVADSGPGGDAGDGSVQPDAGDAGSEDADAGPTDTGMPGECIEGAPELCNGFDDDCDELIDEDVDTTTDTNNCGECGNRCEIADAFAVCVDSVCQMDRCRTGYHDLDLDAGNGCEYRCSTLVPAADDAVCDLRDNDCDNSVDEDVDFESDPSNCDTCGTTCRFAHLVDDNCDGTVDEGDPDGGAVCGISVGECRTGIETCTAGDLACAGEVAPTTELCNGLDDDCDGTVDEGDPESGRLCGSDVGICVRGRDSCVAGALECVGAVEAAVEVCDGLDNNCDGSIDEGNPGGGASCGIGVGSCMAGTETCAGGTLSCTGSVGPSLELCNTLDDDCDGTADEDFDLMSDVLNCGACGNACMYMDAIALCGSGTCSMGPCLPGYVDLNGGTDGCEYACDYRGTEVCNGLDDDCDGTTDIGLSPPMTFCNPNGVCGSTVATCGGVLGWQCMYPAAYEPTETDCDSLDNDCDGSVDEGFPLLATSCAFGAGACRTTGAYVCNAAGDNVECNAAAPGVPADEECDNIDNDCDGTIDERVADDPGTAWRDGIDLSAIDTVTVDRSGGGTMQMMTYEASRPDATSTGAGNVAAFACSRANVQPWSTVTWPEARDACCGLNPGGACPGSGAGWRLCDAPDWQSACEGPAGTCDWSYASACTTSQPAVCNGDEYDCDSGSIGDQDCLFPTGSPTFSSCRTSWGAAGSVHDLSGNVREWTNTSVAAGVYELRGGSFTSIEDGRQCGFDFAVAAQDFAHPGTGFRCCNY